MCVAYPGKVLSIENSHARVDFTGSVVPVNISMVDVAPGDFVLVHARKWKRKKQKSGLRCFRIWRT